MEVRERGSRVAGGYGWEQIESRLVTSPRLQKRSARWASADSAGALAANGVGSRPSALRRAGNDVRPGHGSLTTTTRTCLIDVGGPASRSSTSRHPRPTAIGDATDHLASTAPGAAPPAVSRRPGGRGAGACNIGYG